MAERKSRKVIAKVDPNSVLENSMAEVFGLTGPFSANGGNPYAPQISQTNTIFENLRWYLVSNMRQPLSEAYVELGLVQTVVDVPVDDGLRGGIEVQSQQLSEEQIQELLISIDRDDDLNTAGQAAKWNRLYGGAGIMIIVGDQDPQEPLNLKAIGKDTSLEFRAVDMWELFWDKQNTEGYDPEIQTQEFEEYSYYGEKIHKSRVMRLKGMVAPSFIRPRLRGWGFSVVEVLIRSINQYLKATDLSFAVLDEFKVDVYKIKNLMNTLMSPQGQQSTARRIQFANWQKNYQNALVMDSEDDWDHKQLSFAGLAETMEGIRMQVAADMRMPITKLFGTSASKGLGNTDQNDMENYNSMVEAQVRNKLKYDILRICEIKCQKLFQFIPDDLQIEFKPLRVLSATDEEVVKTSKFARLMQARSIGEISSEQFIDACNRDTLLGIQMDSVALEDGNLSKEGIQDPAKPKDVDDPGANREDRRKPVAWEYGGEPTDPKPKTLNSDQAQLPAADMPVTPVPPAPNAEKVIYQSDFDYMAYVEDGGDDWISVAQMQYYKHPTDEFLWQQARDASLKYIKTHNEKFEIWWYRKMGGRFGDAPIAKKLNKKGK